MRLLSGPILELPPSVQAMTSEKRIKIPDVMTGNAMNRVGNFSLTANKSAAPRVLVVDDERLVRWSLAETLADAGYDVAEACDGEAAIGTIIESSPPVDLVLLDLRLPDSNDLSVLSEIRRLSPATAVILMTAFGTPEIVAEALDLGVFSVMAKPFEMRDLAPLAARALSSH
jgi:two-component system, NtrC family, response regulator AtoC